MRSPLSREAAVVISTFSYRKTKDIFQISQKTQIIERQKVDRSRQSKKQNKEIKEQQRWYGSEDEIRVCWGDGGGSL
jgi:hypothetical protein